MMWHCKDCLYSKVCKDWWSERKENLFPEITCRTFTNRSEWVHLPCKVGDTVWFITGIGNNLIKPALVKEIIVDSKGIKNLYVYGNGHNFENSFNIFYLTPEEAEKALEERNNG